MKATISIQMDGAAFEDPQELPRILKDLAERLEQRGSFESGDSESVLDMNGNHVGMLKITGGGQWKGGE
jgi:hypothetical protein